MCCRHSEVWPTLQWLQGTSNMARHSLSDKQKHPAIQNSTWTFGEDRTGHLVLCNSQPQVVQDAVPEALHNWQICCEVSSHTSQLSFACVLPMFSQYLVFLYATLMLSLRIKRLIEMFRKARTANLKKLSPCFLDDAGTLVSCPWKESMRKTLVVTCSMDSLAKSITRPCKATHVKCMQGIGWGKRKPAVSQIQSFEASYNCRFHCWFFCWQRCLNNEYLLDC